MPNILTSILMIRIVKSDKRDFKKGNEMYCIFHLEDRYPKHSCTAQKDNLGT